MSRSSNRAAQNVARFSSHSPHVRGFGRRAREQEEQVDDTVGEAPDRYAAIAEALEDESLSRHELVTAYGFAPDQLLTPDGTPIGFEVLAVAAQAAEAAKELGKAPRHMGVMQLFKEVSNLREELQARMAARKASGRPERRIRREGTGTQRSLPPMPSSPPAGADHLGRVDNGAGYVCICCGAKSVEAQMRVPSFDAMKARQRGPDDERVFVEAGDLWKHAVCRKCSRELNTPHYSLVDTRERMERSAAEREQRRRQFEARQRQRGGDWFFDQPPSTTPSTGKTARKRAAKARRTG